MKNKFVVLKINKSGFTLIELLAVILIIAIIALISIPVVANIVEEVKKQAFKVTATNVVDAADKDCNVLLQKGGSVAKTYTIANYAITNSQDLSISGKLPLQGSVAVNNSCDVAIAVNNKKWCASKNYTDDKVKLTDYVDGNCNYDGGGTAGKELLVDKIGELRGSELTNGVNLGANEYDKAIEDKGLSTIGYYAGKYFSGSNPNNYITVDGKMFRIIGLTNQGIAVVGDTGSYVIDEGYGNFSLDADFKLRFNDLGLVKSASYFSSTNNGYDNIFGHYDNETSTTIGGTVSYGVSSLSSYALLSFYDYELTIDRGAYATCLKSNTVVDDLYAITAQFVSCAPTSWLGNNIYLNMGFYFYGTAYVSTGYLSSGKFTVAESTGGSDGICTDCTRKLKLLIRNDSYYVSGTGTSSDPFVYKTAYDASNFTQNDCFTLDGAGNQITSFDNENSACLKDIVIPAEIKGKPITGIGANAFTNAGITSINWSNATNLQEIGANAFSGNLLTGSLTLPSNITTIGSEAFAGNAISGELIIPSNVTEIGYSTFAGNNIEALTFATGSKLLSLGSSAFAGNNSLVGTIDLPAAFTSMGDNVFFQTQIDTINIPNSATTFSDDALGGTVPFLTTINVDKAYNGLAQYPWGNTNATINWLRSATYNLTYDNSKVIIGSSCLKDGKYIGNCTVDIISNQSGYRLGTYKVNGVQYNSGTFAMPEADATITDTTFIEGYVLESPHPYSNNMNQTYTVKVSGATKIQVTFNSSTLTENNYDNIYLTDSTGTQVGTSSYYTGTGLASKVFIVTGDTINVRLTSDSSQTGYGFYADIVKYE